MILHNMWEGCLRLIPSLKKAYLSFLFNDCHNLYVILYWCLCWLADMTLFISQRRCCNSTLFFLFFIPVPTSVSITNAELFLCNSRKPSILPARRLRRIKLRTTRRLCACTNLLFSTSSMWWNVRHKTAHWYYCMVSHLNDMYAIL